MGRFWRGSRDRAPLATIGHGARDGRRRRCSVRRRGPRGRASRPVARPRPAGRDGGAGRGAPTRYCASTVRYRGTTVPRSATRTVRYPTRATARGPPSAAPHADTVGRTAAASPRRTPVAGRTPSPRPATGHRDRAGTPTAHRRGDARDGTRRDAQRDGRGGGRRGTIVGLTWCAVAVRAGHTSDSSRHTTRTVCVGSRCGRSCILKSCNSYNSTYKTCLNSPN